MVKKVVYAYLVADILHYGHIQHLYKAKHQGNYLIVGILTDKATMEKKPKPILPYLERKRTMEAIKYVDEVIPQHEYSPLENVKRLHPDVLMESESHSKQPANEYVKEYGGEVIVTPYYKGISSTSIKDKVKKEWKIKGGQNGENVSDKS